MHCSLLAITNHAFLAHIELGTRRAICVVAEELVVSISVRCIHGGQPYGVSEDVTGECTTAAEEQARHEVTHGNSVQEKSQPGDAGPNIIADASQPIRKLATLNKPQVPASVLRG